MQDATFLSEQLKDKKLSFSELITDITEKAEKMNPQINALVTFDPEKAIHEYQAKPSISQTLFAGVPIPLKMLGQSKAGWPATASSKLQASHIAQYTDCFSTKLEQIGFVPLGQTNTPEFGFKNVTDPTLTGITRNPWKLDHYSGGSSGGAAAAVAAGIFPAAAASDGGGSIRIPASFCGLIGLKPTRGTMPTGPGNWRSWQGASINFALTVSMRDTIQMFYAMRESQPSAAYQAPLAEWQQTKPANRKKLKIAYTTKSPVDTIVSTMAKDAVREAILFFQAQGHEVEEVQLPIDGIELMRQYYIMNGADTASMFTKMSQTMNRSLTNQDMEPMTWGIYQYGLKIPAYRYVESLNYWDQCAAQMEHLFESYDLLLTPTNADTAPKISEDLQSDRIRKQLLQAQALTEEENAALIWQMFAKSLAITPFTQLANLTGQPAISLPTSLGTNGLPLGIQLMAARGREDLLFQAGLLFEKENKFILPLSYR